jgi:hypothetical protein
MEVNPMAREPKQTFPIPALDSERGTFEIELSTRKHSNGQIVSAAHGQNVRDGMVTFMLYGDFSKTYMRATGTATQRALDTQHATAFGPAMLPQITADCLAFYAEKNSKTCIARDCGRAFDSSIPETRNPAALRSFSERYCPACREGGNAESEVITAITAAA